MSLADLPDVLIAHLCSYLEYPDICNLMETSIKNYNAIKYYKKDKLNVNRLSLQINRNSANGSARGKFENIVKHYRFNRQTQSYGCVESVIQILDQCSSIENVRCHGFDDDFCKAIIRTKTPIGSVRNIRSVSASPAHFISLCQKIKSVELGFRTVAVNMDLFDDEVFIKCLPSLQLKFISVDFHMALKLTNRTLEALSEKNICVFMLENVTTSFTIEGIVKAIQVMRQSGTEDFLWDLATLLPGQREDLERYFNPRTGELRNQYTIKVTNDDYSHIKYYELSFGPKPGELVGNNYVIFNVAQY